MKTKIKLITIYYPQTSGGYTIICPELMLTTQGEDIKEAENMMKELIEDYFENDKTMEFSDYVESFNTGNKIITEIDYEYTESATRF